MARVPVTHNGRHDTARWHGILGIVTRKQNESCLRFSGGHDCLREAAEIREDVAEKKSCVPRDQHMRDAEWQLSKQLKSLWTERKKMAPDSQSWGQGNDH